MGAYPYFPVFIDLSKKRLLVIGAGRIASRRVRVLSDFTDGITVIAPKIHPELVKLEASGKIRILRKEYEDTDLQGADLVLAATDSAGVNDRICEACRDLGIPVNVCSDRKKCDFFFPGIVRKEQVVVGVSAGGEDHREAKRITEAIRETLKSEDERKSHH